MTETYMTDDKLRKLAETATTLTMNRLSFVNGACVNSDLSVRFILEREFGSVLSAYSAFYRRAVEDVAEAALCRPSDDRLRALVEALDKAARTLEDSEKWVLGAEGNDVGARLVRMAAHEARSALSAFDQPPRESEDAALGREDMAKAASDEKVWRVCRAMSGDCQNCDASQVIIDDICVCGCYTRAVEVINTVETGNPWRKTQGVKPPWTVLNQPTRDETEVPEAEGHGERWITLQVKRALYLDDGRERVLCDRLPSPATLVLKLAKEASASSPDALRSPQPWRPDRGASIEEYVENYEFRGDADYRPSESECELLIDALHGWEAEKATLNPPQETECGGVEGLIERLERLARGELLTERDWTFRDIFGEAASTIRALRSAPQPWRPDREAVARIIDPEAWENIEGHRASLLPGGGGLKALNEHLNAQHTSAIKELGEPSLTKADLILALPSKDTEG